MPSTINSLADFNNAVQKIRSAPKGRDVRTGIADGLQYVVGKTDEVNEIQQDVIDLLEEIQNGDFDYITEDDVMDIIDRYITTSKNVFDLTSAVKYPNKCVSISGGSMGAMEDTTDYDTYKIPVKASTVYSMKRFYIGFYLNSGGTDIGYFGVGSNSDNYQITTPAGTTHIIFSINKKVWWPSMTNFMVYEGSSYPSTYVAPGSTVLGYNLSSMSSDIDLLKSGGGSGSIQITRSKNAFDLATAVKYTNKQVPINAGSMAPMEDSTSYDTYKIAVKANTMYSMKRFYIVFFLDSSGNDIGWAGVGSSSDDYQFTTPAGTTHIIFSVRKDLYWPSMTNFMVYEGSSYPSTYVAPGRSLTVDGEDINAYINSGSSGSSAKYLNKKYLLFGDSYTDMQGAGKHWVTRFENIMQPQIVWNMAKAGASYGRGVSGGTERGYDHVDTAISDSTISNPDVILFFYGANESSRQYDFDVESYFTTTDGSTRPLSEMEPLMKNSDNSLPVAHMIAAMRYDIQKVMNAYPDAKIFICTQTQNNIHGGYSNQLFKRNKQIEVAERMSVEVIDTFTCGIFEQMSDKYLPYNQHPSELGAKLIADKIIRSVKDYFNTAND